METKICRSGDDEQHRESEDQLARHGRSPNVIPTARAART
jgi:hypothetical protein